MLSAPLIEIGLTDLYKSEGATVPPPPGSDSGVPHLRGRDIGVAMERSIVILDISAKNEVLDKK